MHAVLTKLALQWASINVAVLFAEKAHSLQMPGSTTKALPDPLGPGVLSLLPQAYSTPALQKSWSGVQANANSALVQMFDETRFAAHLSQDAGDVAGVNDGPTREPEH